jgi:hypothetical protein
VKIDFGHFVKKGEKSEQIMSKYFVIIYDATICVRIYLPVMIN